MAAYSSWAYEVQEPNQNVEVNVDVDGEAEMEVDGGDLGTHNVCGSVSLVDEDASYVNSCTVEFTAEEVALCLGWEDAVELAGELLVAAMLENGVKTYAEMLELLGSAAAGCLGNGMAEGVAHLDVGALGPKG